MPTNQGWSIIDSKVALMRVNGSALVRAIAANLRRIRARVVPPTKGA